jgi:hypothetical protein
MTTKELIAKLQQTDPDGEANVSFVVRGGKHSFYLDPAWIEKAPYGLVRVNICLPEGVHTVQRKK